MAREVDMYSRIKNRTDNDSYGGRFVQNGKVVDDSYRMKRSTIRTDNDSYRTQRSWKNRTDERRAGMNGEQE